MNVLQSKLRILMVGGGSGGHFYPLIALAEKLNADARKPILYYAGPTMYDAESLVRSGFIFVHIDSGKNRRYASFLNISDSVKVCWGSMTALIKLFYIYPDVIVSKGGYTSVPVILAAAFLRIPIIVHESDSVIGRANSFAARYARIFITSYTDVKPAQSRAFVTKIGIPSRSALLTTPTPDALTKLGINPSRPIIFVVGGSQGAERINALILDSLDELLTRYTVIHQTGKDHFDTCVLSAETLIPDIERREHYHPLPFLDEVTLNTIYHLAHLVISRAGSTSLHEIALHAKPSIIIPIGESVSHDQRTNAYTYARTGAASVMEEGNLTDNLLMAEIERIIGDDTVYERMVAGTKNFANPHAAEDIVALIFDVAEQH